MKEPQIIISLLDVYTNLDNAFPEPSPKDFIVVLGDMVDSHYNIYTDKDYIDWCKRHNFYKYRYDPKIVDLYLRLCGEGLTK